MAYGLSQTTPTAATWNNSGQYYTFSSGDSVSSTQINSNFSQLFNQLQNSASQLATILGGTLTSSGALNLNAGGTNQNITLTPSGSGYTVLNGSVGIGTSSPTSSALLNLQSTTQGFLPPVMTYAQKNAISSPATGLQVVETPIGGTTITVTGTGGSGTSTVPSAALWVYNGNSWVTPGPVLLAKYTAAGGETAIALSNIPQTFNHLRVRMIAAGNNTPSLILQIGSDTTGAHYISNQIIMNNDGSPQSGTINYDGGIFCGALSSDAHAPSDFTAQLPLYAVNGSFYKTSTCVGGEVMSEASNNTGTYQTVYLGTGYNSGAYPGNSPITSLTITTSNGTTTFTANSVFLLYGEM